MEATSWWTVEVHPLLLAMFLFSSTERVGTFHLIIFNKYVSKITTIHLEGTPYLHNLDSNHTVHSRHLWRRHSQRYVFGPKLEDTRHDDVPSAAAGLKCIVPARDIIASNFLHNINIYPSTTHSLRGHHTYISTTCHAPVLRTILTSLRHGRRGSSSASSGEGLLVLLPEGEYPLFSHEITPLTRPSPLRRLMATSPP